MSEPRRPEDDPSAQPSTDQPQRPSDASSDMSGDLTVRSASASTGSETRSSDPDTALTGSSGSTGSAGSSSGSPTEPVSTETVYQPAYTTPSYQQPQQPAYPPGYQPPYEQQTAQYQQPAAPYQQPANAWQQPWATAETPAREHHHSLGVAIASVILGFFGVFFTLMGLIALLGGGPLADLIRQQGTVSAIDLDQMLQAFTVVGIIGLVLGIPHLLAAIWAPLHRNWARVLGIIVAVLGCLLGVLALLGSQGSSTQSLPDGTTVTTTGSPIATALLFFVPYGFTLIALLLSRRHFRSG